VVSGVGVASVVRTFLVSLLLCASAQAATWQVLEEGLEFGRFESATLERSPDGDLMVLRVSPEKFSLKLFAMDTDEKSPGRDVAEWCAEFDLMAAINAGMYQADHRTHVGFCKIDGEVVNGFANDYLSVAAFEPVGPEDPPFRIFDLDATPLVEIRARYKNVVQNLRLIKRSGENRWQPSVDQWREAALAEDSDGRILLIYCDTSMSMHEFNTLLLALPLNVVAAQHLEGRSPARFWVNHENLPGKSPLRTAGPALPNVIGVVRIAD
jgi:hypothetical protein